MTQPNEHEQMTQDTTLLFMMLLESLDKGKV